MLAGNVGAYVAHSLFVKTDCFPTFGAYQVVYRTPFWARSVYSIGRRTIGGQLHAAQQATLHQQLYSTVNRGFGYPRSLLL